MPYHLAPLAEVAERCRYERTFTTVSVANQHGKTTLVQAILVWLLKYTNLRHAYASYGIDRGESVSREMQELASRVGIPWEGNRGEWRTPTGAQLIATGVDGALTGFPVSGLCVIDDALKNREDANSQARRDQAWSFLQSTASTRLHPSSSLLVVATRWHIDDLIGRIKNASWKKVKWVHINLPAILDNGQPLWPSQRPLWYLEQQQELLGPSEWASLMMGQPVALGQELFGNATLYNEVPKGAMRIAFGVDLGYTTKSRSDHSVIVKLGAHENGNYYVLDVMRRQVHVDKLADELVAIAELNPGIPWRWYGDSAGEQGAGDLIRARIPSFRWVLARGKKHVRAQAVSAKWRAGKVQVPAHSPVWKKPFLEIVTRFTGDGDRHDDDVDALAAAFDALNHGSSAFVEMDGPTGLVQSWENPRRPAIEDSLSLGLNAVNPLWTPPETMPGGWP